jgi:sigma-B regulation protein RsbU (phosphoserine phosphatase)
MSLKEILQSNDPPAKNDLTDDELIQFFMKYKGLLKERERDRSFWAATNENLKMAYNKLDEKEKELEKAYSTIREDLSVASQIQEALLPKMSKTMEKELDLAVYHKQLAEVGGDYYDFFRSKRNQYAIGVFDISGHGVSAALVMTYLKAQFMTVIDRLESPKEIVEWVNNISYSFLKTVKKYATVNFVVFSGSELTYVNGGGFGLLVSGKEPHLFVRKDPFLGLRCKPFHEYSLSFEENDVLALYTDGLVEAQNKKAVDYSVKRLNNLIIENSGKSSKQILDICLKDYRGYRSKDTDDITLIIIRKKK